MKCTQRDFLKSPIFNKYYKSWKNEITFILIYTNNYNELLIQTYFLTV